MIALPAYIDREAWDALIEARKAKRVPTTDYAAKLLLYEVQRIKDAGHDPNAAIKQSILKGYTDVYAPKEKEIERKVANTADDRIECERAAAAKEKARVDAYIARTTGNIRRVA